ncbi:MAG: transcription antitermination factor NusB [Planctomycetia bacterium]
MRSRTRARQLALQFLFQLEVQGDEAREMLDGWLAHELGGRPGGEEARAYAVRLVDGVRTHRDALDTRIRQAARNWDLQRMAGVDRSALRIGCYELMHEPEVPMKVAINEAIELGKMFSTESSGAFINGILDRIRKDLGR